MLAKNAEFALHNLYCLLNQVNIKTSEKCKLFDTLVLPIMHYCSEIWGENEAKDIENIHLKFCRKILQVKRSTNLEGLYGELGRLPLLILRKINLIRYWIKIIKLPNSSLVKRMYNSLKYDVDNRTYCDKSNWAFKIKSILENAGLSYLWTNQTYTTYMFDQIKNRIIDMYKQSWYGKIYNSQRLASYSRYKHSFEIEEYLNCIDEDKYRICVI